MYASVAELKQYLGITWNSEDALLTAMLNASNSQLNKLLGVDTLAEAVTTEKVKRITEGDHVNVYLKNWPVQEIQQIGGANYTGAYEITHGRKVSFNYDVLNKINEFGTLLIKYKHGYTTVPDDVKLMEIMLASGRYTTKWYDNVSSYKLGDEQITFGGANGQTPANEYYTFKALLDNYKTFYMPY